MMAWALALLQTLLFVLAAPLLAGWIKRCRCGLQNRAAPPVWQPYRDLARLFGKDVVVADTTSWLFRRVPYVVFGAAVLAASVVPLIATRLPTSAIADVIVLVGFFALGRFALALGVLESGPVTTHGQQFHIDALNVYLVVLTASVAMTTAVFSRPYVAHERERGRVGARAMRLYHSMYQGFLFTMLLALTTNNLGVLWVALEAATLATVLLVSLYRTPEAVEAAWKYFILCGVGIAQALFGTVLLYFAQERLVGIAPDSALHWQAMYAAAADLEPTVLVLAFVFLLVGYGTKVGLVPMHKSAIFVTVGHAAQIAGTQSIERIRGLVRTQPSVGWGLLIATAAIAGFPIKRVRSFAVQRARGPSCAILAFAVAVEPMDLPEH